MTHIGKHDTKDENHKLAYVVTGEKLIQMCLCIYAVKPAEKVTSDDS